MANINLPVLVLNDTVLLPSNEIRMNFDSSLEKQLFSLAESYYDSNLLIINRTTNPTLEVNKISKIVFSILHLF